MRPSVSRSRWMGLGGVVLGTILGMVLGAASYEAARGGQTSDSGLAHAAPSRRPSPPAGFSRFDKLESLARALTLLEREYVLPVDGEALIEAALQGMTARLDPHTSYLPADEAKMLLEDIDGRFGGVGIVVSMRTLESGVLALEIMEVLERGPVRGPIGRSQLDHDHEAVAGRLFLFLRLHGIGWKKHEEHRGEK